MKNVTIYHNPSCGTSRNTLTLIRDSGIEPTIIPYLKQPPSPEQLLELLSVMGMHARELLRSKEALYRQLDLDAQHLSEDELIQAIYHHPVLMNRPLVVTPLGARLCRPAEIVLEILPKMH